jgi:hypothetical protein
MVENHGDDVAIRQGCSGGHNSNRQDERKGTTDQESDKRRVTATKNDCEREENILSHGALAEALAVSLLLATLQSGRPTYADQDGASRGRTIARGKENQAPIIMRKHTRQRVDAKVSMLIS